MRAAWCHAPLRHAVMRRHDAVLFFGMASVMCALVPTGMDAIPAAAVQAADRARRR